MNRMGMTFLIAGCLSTLSACQSAREYKTPSVPLEIEFVDLLADGNERFIAAEPISAWWENFGDSELTRVINQAFTTNQDVQIALANLLEARSISRETAYDRFPSVTARGSAIRSRQNEQSANVVDIGFDSSWELDLFKRVSYAADATEAREAVANANLRDVYVSLSAEVARTYMEILGAEQRRDIALRNLEIQRETLELTKRLAEGGRGTELDISRAQTQLRITEASIPGFEAQISAAINRLSVLTGQAPDTLVIDLDVKRQLPSLPAAVGLGNATDLLRRRPDVSRAERELAAAVADYNVAVADQFPMVNIIGTLGFAATNFASFGASAVVASGGAAVSWPAFDMGRVRARIEQNDARALAATASYEKVVLEALESVKTAVSNFSKEEERRGSLQFAASSASRAGSMARQRYESGLDTFIDVLSADAARLDAEDALALSELNAALNLISVYKALGGGWKVWAEE